ncbi:MAG: hypothetical protein EWV78_04735 [Microcystis aeruginosa Ma_MB_F_20061100_S20D]|uniref:Uncharacterized protein n=1 Tax=Microcystis aeruginosa Ma_MB_F_20061100_S20D TaxID=2486253 RepID=A0A552EW04_MICAE|nr:MAG: hypothetical protein EWV78_04735 [Microcystis aeruginosa Ma_MB_F_20061100_S20D]
MLITQSREEPLFLRLSTLIEFYFKLIICITITEEPKIPQAPSLQSNALKLININLTKTESLIVQALQA